MNAALSRQPARRLLAIVVALHVLALLVIGQSLKPQRRGAPPDAAPVAITWLQWPRVTAPEPAHRDVEQATRPVPATPRRPVAIDAPRTAPTEPVAITVVPDAPPAAAAPASVPSSAPPLDLRLPSSSRNAGAMAARPPAALAIDDPRVRSAPLSGDERLAQAIGTDLRLRESTEPDGTRRFQRGKDCVVARQAREAQLNPFNQSTRPTPRLVTGC
ncbi:hypothetical protein [Aquabacterium humicola]|uniref:hypothetical protein n=1 Tax=Aquabacterium humicola TaxID=3237377 RepID=UPI002542805E|nr:hypothetical protein [Rubrivivax pictus]